MQKAAVLIRSARPDEGEGLLFARYMDQAAEGFFGFLLGKNAEAIMARAYCEPGHSLSFEHVMFAEHDGVVAGMTSAFTGEQHRTFSDEPLKRAAGRSAFRMKCVKVLMAPLWGILNTVAEGDFYLQGMAVDPDRRGSGIGSILLADTEERAREAGSARLSLDVSHNNKGARKLYARKGMVESSCWPASSLLPTLFVRMTKGL